MRAAFRCRHGIAVGLHEAVGFAEPGGGPGNGPLHLSGFALALKPAGEGFRCYGLEPLDPFAQEIRKAVREAEGRLGGGLVMDA